MRRNTRLIAAFLALFMSMCTFYDQSGAIVAPNGLSCQNLTTYDSIQGQRSISSRAEKADVADISELGRADGGEGRVVRRIVVER